MKILVYDLPAVSGGALTILESYYQFFLRDQENKYVFVISLPELTSQKNIRVLKFPWVKKSRLHRLYFDYFECRKINKKEKPDRIISLQNLMIPRTPIPQTIYVHQVIPFSDYKFSITKDYNLWFYKHIYKLLLFKSIREADKVIIQSNWLRDLIIEKKLSTKEKIIVEKPNLDYLDDGKPNSEDRNHATFIYPAGPEIYKNHKIIIEAMLRLKSINQNYYRVLFTLNGNENKGIKKIKELVYKNNLPVEFIGNNIKHELIQIYKESTLIYPSKIESLGLPIYECMKLNRPIIACLKEYSIELLSNYKNAKFFEDDDINGLSEIMFRKINI